VRTGQQYLESLRDRRCVVLDGERVQDVTAHPAFVGIIATIAAMYDAAADRANGMCYQSPEAGGGANKVFMIPRSREDLADWRAAITAWALHSRGFVGRSPDHVAAFLAGFAAAPEVFAAEGRPFADNVVRYQRRAASESLFTSYTIIPPQINRATTAHAWDEELLQVGVLEERDDGIVVRGSQMLGTSTAVCDTLLVSCIRPLSPDDERYANTFVVPMSAPGLKVYCRRPYGTGHPSAFDYPLSSRFDETDALVVFDDVFIPWDDVFVYRDVARLRRQWFETAAHVLGNAQAQIRLVVKLKFLLGLARRVTIVNGIDGIPAVQDLLGELAALVAPVEASILAAEATCSRDAHGVARPNPRFLYGAMGNQAQLYTRVLQILRELVGGGVIQLPSSYRELVEPATRTHMERYLRSGDTCAEDRVKLFKLVWDAIGSEFAGRHHQYEMFYAGAPFVARGYAMRSYGYEEALASADEFLASYDLASVVSTPPAPPPGAGAGV
jgi:4-hydroxyphenylacetate 3-monooxygenase